ncbi:hypothetical protein [Lacrimispora sp. 38-1]|uniref:hypothetical protein n=1 Tax=Lacrimispora sp. 38-1 TaxID=3125778 RepID=UPI003CF2575F
MGQYNKAVLTAAGEKLIARALAGEIKLGITQAKTSDYAYPDSTDLKSLKDMQGIKQTVRDPETTVLNETMIQTRVLFSNEEIASTYYIHNIGLYALDGTEEVLFCIVTAEIPDEMPQYNGVASTSYIYNIQNVVKEGGELNITVNPSGTATIQDVTERVDSTGGDISETVIETLDTIEDKYPLPAAGENVKRFFGKVLTFLRNIRPLTGDITLYVSANTGSDDTGNGSELNPYASVTKALSVIPKDLNTKTATVQIADGIYTEDVVVAGFHSGALIVRSNTPDAINEDCVIKAMLIHSCNGNIEIRGISIQEDTTQNAIELAFVSQCSFIYISLVKSNAEKIGVSVWASKIRIYNSKISNHNYAIMLQQNSQVYSENNGGINNHQAVGNFTGSIISCVGFQPLGTSTSVFGLGSLSISNYGAQIGTLSSDIILYVATTGSDATGDGTSEKPFKSIQHAIDIIPKDLNGYSATIDVSAGTYPENLFVLGFHSGSLNLYSDTKDTLADTCRVNAITISKFGAGYLRVNGFNFIATSRETVVVTGSYGVYFYYCQSTAPSTYTAMQINESSCSIHGCKVTNRNHGASFSNSVGMSSNWSESTNNTVGISSFNGARVTISGPQPTGTANMLQGTGGMFVYDNGTQISGLISSGLSCTWGTIYGGYIRHGNLNGVAMVTIQIGVNLTTNLSIGTAYYISGFPRPTHDTAVNCNVAIGNLYLVASTGQIRIELMAGQSLYAGNAIVFNCTYMTNS